MSKQYPKRYTYIYICCCIRQNYRKERERERNDQYEGPEMTHFRGVELQTTGYVVTDKWVSAIILIIRANFPCV